MSDPFDPKPAAIEEAERDLLSATIIVWREIDRLTAAPGGYRGLDAATDLRLRERAAWERLRYLVDGERSIDGSTP